MIFNECIIFEHREEKCNHINSNYFQASYKDKKTEYKQI